MACGLVCTHAAGGEVCKTLKDHSDAMCRLKVDRSWPLCLFLVRPDRNPATYLYILYVFMSTVTHRPYRTTRVRLHDLHAFMSDHSQRTPGPLGRGIHWSPTTCVPARSPSSPAPQETRQASGRFSAVVFPSALALASSRACRSSSLALSSCMIHHRSMCSYLRRSTSLALLVPSFSMCLVNLQCDGHAGTHSQEAKMSVSLVYTKATRHTKRPS